MAKVKEEKTNVMRTLEQKQIPYTAHTYPTDGGAMDGVSVAAYLGRTPSRCSKRWWPRVLRDSTMYLTSLWPTASI